MKTEKYVFRAKVWKYKGHGGWHFVTLPKKLAAEVRKNHSLSEEGWGRLPATAQIGESTWHTAIWFDSKAKSYLLPIKAAIRKTEKIQIEKTANITLMIPVEGFRHAL